MNIEGLADEAIENFLEGIFEGVMEDDIDNCCDCNHLTRTTDPFSTGDSPTEYECEANDKMECPYVQEAVDSIKELISIKEMVKENEKVI